MTDKDLGYFNMDLSRTQRFVGLLHIIIALCLFLSILILGYTSHTLHTRNAQRFENRTKILLNSLDNRVDAYLLALRGGRGLIHSNGDFDRRIFDKYVKSLQLDTYYPGILGVGFSKRLSAGEKEAFTEAVRKETGDPAFHIWPDGAGPEYHAVIYLYPGNERNAAAMGYDMFTNAERREAMMRAADTGEPAASSAVTLVQEIGRERQPGFVLYMPVYRGGEVPAAVEERRRLLDGFIYSPFRAGDLFEGLFHNEAFNYIHFDVFDGTVLSPEHLIYTSSASRPKKPAFTKTVRFSMAGRTWSIRFAAKPGESQFIPLFAGIEILLFLFLFTVTSLLGKTQARLASKAAELRDAEERLRAVVESNPNGLLVFGREGNIVLANRQAEALFEYSKTELCGLSAHDLVSESHRGLVAEAFANARGEGRTVSLEVQARKKSGLFFPAELLVNGMTPGDGRFFICAAVDITEKKAREEEIRQQNERLAESNTELEQFAYIASHDLQEPLRTVSNFAEFLKVTYQGKFDEDADEGLRHIKEAAVRAQLLIQDLLEYGRLGRSRTAFEAVDLSAALEKTLQGLAVLISESGADIQVDRLPVVSGDPLQLAQLLQNLIQNAIKYRAKNRRLKIRLQCSSSGRDWVFSVSDNGIGIERRHFDRIFRVFQRLHTRAEYPGTGIGLAVCKKIIERHGGKIWVSSEPDKGTTFYFSLPKARLRESPEMAQANASGI